METRKVAVLKQLASDDIQLLIRKGREYGDSWKKRGGVGAYMMLARKWDRIEKAAEESGYDIFRALQEMPTLIDDVIDLGCYLMLVRTEGFITENFAPDPEPTIAQAAYNAAKHSEDPTVFCEGCEPEAHGYVDQDHDEFWNKTLPEREAKKRLTRMGDSELLDFLEVEFAYVEDERHEFSEHKHTLMLNLQMYHQAVMTNQRPHRDLEDIMNACRFVIAYSNPYKNICDIC